MIYYSKTTKGFYREDIHGTNIPSDCVKITEQTWKELLESQSKGKVIQPDERGYPIAIKPSVIPPTWEEIKKKRDVLLKDSDWSVAADANPKPSKEAWLNYRQALRDVPQNFSDPSKVIWPKTP